MLATDGSVGSGVMSCSFSYMMHDVSSRLVTTNNKSRILINNAIVREITPTVQHKHT